MNGTFGGERRVHWFMSHKWQLRMESSLTGVCNGKRPFLFSLLVEFSMTETHFFLPNFKCRSTSCWILAHHAPPINLKRGCNGGGPCNSPFFVVDFSLCEISLYGFFIPHLFDITFPKKISYFYGEINHWPIWKKNKFYLDCPCQNLSSPALTLLSNMYFVLFADFISSLKLLTEAFYSKLSIPKLIFLPKKSVFLSSVTLKMCAAKKIQNIQCSSYFSLQIELGYQGHRLLFLPLNNAIALSFHRNPKRKSFWMARLHRRYASSFGRVWVHFCLVDLNTERHHAYFFNFLFFFSILIFLPTPLF